MNWTRPFQKFILLDLRKTRCTLRMLVWFAMKLILKTSLTLTIKHKSREKFHSLLVYRYSSKSSSNLLVLVQKRSAAPCPIAQKAFISWSSINPEYLIYLSGRWASEFVLYKVRDIIESVRFWYRAVTLCLNVQDIGWNCRPFRHLKHCIHIKLEDVLSNALQCDLHLDIWTFLHQN